jgi:flagellar export protein FliJ
MHSDRLQRIIGLKERLMEEKERVLDEHNKERDTICSNVSVLSNEIDANYSELCTRCLDGNEFALLKDYLEHLGHQKIKALAQKELIEKKIALIRAELYDMLKEIKMLDALQERALSAARRTQNRKQQKLLDEIALRLESRKV